MIVFTALFVIAIESGGQTRRIDSINRRLAYASDTARPFLLNKIAEELVDSIVLFPSNQKDSLLRMAEQNVIEAETISRKLNYNNGIGIALFISGVVKVNFALKNFDRAIIDFTSALPYLKAGSVRNYVALCYNAVAEGCHFIGRLDSSIAYYDSAINSYLLVKDTLDLTSCMIWKGHDYFDKGDYKNAYLLGTKALLAAEKTKDINLIGFANQQFLGLFLNAGLPERTIDYFHTIIRLQPLTMPKNGKTTLPGFMPWALWVAGEAYIKMNEVDSAVYLSRFIPLDTTDGDSYRFYGQLHAALHEDEKAIKEFVKGFELKEEVGHKIGLAGTANELGEIYLKRKDFKSAIYYTTYGFTVAEKIHAMLEKRDATEILSEIYSQTGDYKKAWFYNKLYKALNDSMATEQDRKKLTLDLVQNQLDNQTQQSMLLSRENQLKEQQLHNQTLLKNLFIAGAIVFLVIAVILFTNYRQKQKANSLLEQQKSEIQSTLSELRSTQTQLIQSEKMASLGQLTAGIAHEIQNPLNFVNNFSEVNGELINELKEELAVGNLPLATEIADDIQQNLEKVTHHGKRADAIVKRMLEHSRKDTGQKLPTDINSLANEYLKLAYHGMLAKNKDFNSELKTDFDGKVIKINTVPQELGRVLLNVYNNAFYAVGEKLKQYGSEYKPTVSVSTKVGSGNIEINVRDNGSGIPKEILDKIFQPFVTTKPTGEGTGLGLSLSYDIMKFLGGEIKVESAKDEYTEFKIILPSTSI